MLLCYWQHNVFSVANLILQVHEFVQCDTASQILFLITMNANRKIPEGNWVMSLCCGFKCWRLPCIHEELIVVELCWQLAVSAYSFCVGYTLLCCFHFYCLHQREPLNLGALPGAWYCVRINVWSNRFPVLIRLRNCISAECGMMIPCNNLTSRTTC